MERPAAATLYPAEARALSSVTIPWDKLSTGPCVERLHVARQVVGDIISACAAVMPSTSDIDEGDEVPRNSRGVEIAMHWSESALCRMGCSSGDSGLRTRMNNIE